MDKEIKNNIPVTSGNKVTTEFNWSALQQPADEMAQTFGQLLGSYSSPLLKCWGDLIIFDNVFKLAGLRVPSLNVFDREGEVLVCAELPGIDEKNISVSLKDNLLTIKGESKKEEEGDFHRHENLSASFARTVTLPAKVDVSTVKANFNDGILEIKLPKIAP